MYKVRLYKCVTYTYYVAIKYGSTKKFQQCLGIIMKSSYSAMKYVSFPNNIFLILTTNDVTSVCYDLHYHFCLSHVTAHITL